MNKNFTSRSVAPAESGFEEKITKIILARLHIPMYFHTHMHIHILLSCQKNLYVFDVLTCLHTLGMKSKNVRMQLQVSSCVF
jgi:hypothetical protein